VSRVAIATCAVENIDPDGPLLLGALVASGVEAEEVAWDDALVNWDSYDLVVVRSTWDYAARRDEFLTWARSVTNLVNPSSVIEYSSDKHYLDDVAARGFRTVPTKFFDVGATPEFPDVDFVVKPCVGAGSIDVERYASGEQARARAHVEHLHGRGRSVMVQPYVHTVDTLGERALIYIDGSFSHAMTKGAMLNVAPDDRDFLFRREQMSRASPEVESLAFAEGLLDQLELRDLLYARVDLVAATDGWLLMELELVEPSLFLGFDDTAPARLAAGIQRRLR
jgi:glutathione synthase/RimK-type ligase-like ATP-grasp enzyme